MKTQLRKTIKAFVWKLWTTSNKMYKAYKYSFNKIAGGSRRQQILMTAKEKNL